MSTGTTPIMIQWLTEPYWRVRWWLWMLRAPDPPSIYNHIHTHKIDRASYDAMEKRWEEREPRRGMPGDVMRHRARMTALYGPDRNNWHIHTEAGLGGRREIMVFFRKDGWYPVQGVKHIPLIRQAAEHAAANPDTLRIEDIDGVVLWRRNGSEQQN